MPALLTLRAGPDALKRIRSRGLTAADIDILPGASGGAKWLVLGGLDRYLFGEFLQVPRARPLHLIGSSIGSWRMACLAQRDPVAALARGHHAYIYEQRYSRKPSPEEVTRVLTRALDLLLGDQGVQEILTHPWARLHIITAAARGLLASDHRLPLTTGLLFTILGNLVGRHRLARRLERVIFDAAGDGSPFRALADLPTSHQRLTPDNVRAALLASGSIPLLMQGVRIPNDPDRLYWDGGILDYHPDLDFGSGDGLVLYPHFYEHVIPGWFDKSLPWRRASGDNFRRALLIAPSAAFVNALPGGKIPDRQDFYDFPDAERMARWQQVLDASVQLGDELRELVLTGKLADRVIPW
ncbi:MAG: patatin-like phospholipase family protein [Gemmatimonadaceae bacterium]